MTATAYLDACGFIPASSGTGDFVVSAAITGYQTPASAGAANTAVYSYRAESADKSQWEEGYGGYTVSGTTLARTTVTASSTGSKVSFSAAPNVYVTALSADLQNASLLTSGTLPIARLNGGTANQTVQGDGSFVTQGRKLLNTLTASNSVTLSDVTSFTSSFNDYEIVSENVIPATNLVSCQIQVHSGGAFQTTSYLSAYFVSTSSGVQASGGSTTFIPCGQVGAIANTGAGMSGTFRLYGPVTGTSVVKQWTGAVSHTGNGLHIAGFSSGYWNSTAAIDGIQVLMSSGNITSGTVKIYGLN